MRIGRGHLVHQKPLDVSPKISSDKHQEINGIKQRLRITMREAYINPLMTF